MSFWSKIGKLLTGSTAQENRKSHGLYIVDAERLISSRGGDRPGPLERVDVLRRLAAFASREQVKIQAVFAGKPLREAAHGEEFNGIVVYYSDQASGISDQLIKLAQQSRRIEDVVVITADVATENRASDLGASVMRTSTLRRALEGGGDNGGGGQERSQRQRSRRPRRPYQQDDRSQSSSSSSSSSSESASGGDSSVKDMIDLVE